MSARPKRIVSAAKRSERIERKIEVLNRGSDANAASADARADQERHLVFLVGADDEGEDGENGEAQHAHRAGDLEPAGKREESALADRMRAIEGRRGAGGDELLAMLGGRPILFRSLRTLRRSLRPSEPAR